MWILWGCDVQARKIAQSKKNKHTVYPIGDGEKKRKESQKPRQKRAPRCDSNPRGYEQGIGPAQQRTGKHEPSQAALVIGRINLINTRQDIGNMQGGETRRSERAKMPKGTAATARAREIRCDTWSRERERDSVYQIARRRRKAKSQEFVKKKGPAMRLEPTWV